MSRVHVEWSSSRRANYLEFCKNYPNIKITSSEWKNIIYSFSEEFKFYILESGEKAKLPFNLGTFYIGKKKRKQFKGKNNEYINMAVDWVKSKELGKKIYNFNYHTEGFFFGWKWERPRASFFHISLWDFKPSRVTSRLLAHYLKSDNKYMNLYKEWETMAKTQIKK